MTPVGVILYGPPASGKDTVTRALTRLSASFRYYPRLKVGAGYADGYEMVGESELAQLRRSGDIIFENSRYGNRYVVDRPRLQAMFDADTVPIVHLGQLSGIRVVQASLPAHWLTVLLWCSRQASGDRAASRGTADVTSRLSAWDETQRELRERGCADFAVVIDTEKYGPEEAASVIGRRVAALGAAHGPP